MNLCSDDHSLLLPLLLLLLLLPLVLLVVPLVQVVPSQGFAVQPGSSYTLRIAVADANHGLVDSVLMVPAGALRLTPGPAAVTGGPYAVVSSGCACGCLALGVYKCHCSSLASSCTAV